MDKATKSFYTKLDTTKPRKTPF